MNESLPDSTSLSTVLKTVALHDHLCLIYETSAQQSAAAIRFIQLGLEHGEKCVYVTDENTAATFFDAMRAQGIDVDSAVKKGMLALADTHQIYLKGGHFDPDDMIRFWAENVREAKAAGFLALRFAGEMTWALDLDPGAESLIEYEVTLNRFLHDYDAVCICQYNSRRFTPEVILQVIRTHPIVIYGGLVCKNPYFVPPTELLQPNQNELEVQRLLNNIQAYQRVEIALRASRNEWEQSFNAIADDVCVLDTSGVILRANKTMRDRFEPIYEDLIGLDYRLVYWGTTQPDTTAPWGSVLSGGPAVVVETKLPKVDGWYTVAGYPLYNDQHKQWGAVLVVRDITKRKLAEEELQRLSGRLLQLQDEERQKIARDLHDATGQDLVALATILAQLHALLPSSNRKWRKLVSECQAVADQCIREVRTVSYLLHPPMLDEAGLEDAVRHYVDGFSKRSGIQVELEVSPRFGRIRQNVELTLFRVVQESLTNIHRHSGSRKALIRLDRNSERITLEVRDEGRGIPGSEKKQTGAFPLGVGVGIPSMHERVKQISGRLDIESRSSGTTVRVTIPADD
jgi:PAS domain S-box-containing protein